MYGDVRLSVPPNPAGKLTILSCRFSVVRNQTGATTEVANLLKPNRAKSSSPNEPQASRERRTPSSHLFLFHGLNGERGPILREMHLSVSKPANPFGLKSTTSDTYRQNRHRQAHFRHLSCFQWLSLEKWLFFSKGMDSTYSCPQEHLSPRSRGWDPTGGAGQREQNHPHKRSWNVA